MPAGYLDPRPLGRSGIEVSALSLGSWRTYERLPAEAGLAILRAARDAGINFFDDARYNDETGRAPLPTGYSEVVFGNLFPRRRAAAGRDRRGEQAVVGVLARAERRGRARRILAADGLRLRRPDLCQRAAAEHECDRPGGGGWRPDRRGQGPSMGGAQLVGRHHQPGGQRGRRALGPAAVRGPAAVQPGPAVAGAGRRDDRGTRPGGHGRRRLVLPGRRHPERKVPRAAGSRPRGGNAGRAAGRASGRCGRRAGRPG